MTATGYTSTTGDARKVSKAGDTMTGELVLPDSSPDTALTATSKGYVDNKFATQVTVTALNTFVDDALNRIAAIEDGTAFLDALNVVGNALVSGGDLTVKDNTKGYRFRRGGSALDLEATGADLILSNWSGTGFNGTQRSYARMSADAQNTQWAGKFELVDALYGTTRHVLDGAANTLGFHGATPVAKQTVTGSRGGNAALASLLSALAALGLITDGTSA